ncbi:MAG: DUF3291 domain-containing protein [Pseudomonadota bacterium]
MAIAQFNVARARWPLDDPRMAEFSDNIARMNALAERSPGFLWRDPGKAEALGDPRMTWTLSLWESAEALAAFAFNTAHRRFFARRDLWFPALEHPAIVLWQAAPLPRPTLAEAERRLWALHRDGPSDEAFGWERFEALRARREAVA